MDNIIEKTKRGLSEGFEKFLKKNYDGHDAERNVIKAAPEETTPIPTPDTPPAKSVSPERPIMEHEPVPKAIRIPPITWYILRYKYRKGGSRIAMVVIVHGTIKEEYCATEWLRHARLEPTLSSFISAVVNAVKPETQIEAMLAESLDFS